MIAFPTDEPPHQGAPLSTPIQHPAILYELNSRMYSRIVTSQSAKHERQSLAFCPTWLYQKMFSRKGSAMKIVVLAKEVPDTWSDRKIDLETGQLNRLVSEPVPDEINERALELALVHKDHNPKTEIVLVSIGPETAKKSLRKLLAMGADSAVLVSDEQLAGSDMTQTARVLAAAVQPLEADLILAGDVATDGRGGMIPAMLSQLLGIPLLPGLEDSIISEDTIRGTAQIDGGTIQLSATYPAVASITERAAEPRFASFKGIRRAKKKPLDTRSLTDLALTAGPETKGAQSVMVSAADRPERSAGPKITDDGTAAAQLVEFLTTKHLI